MFTPKACSMMLGTVAAALAHGGAAQDHKLALHSVGSGGGSGAGEELQLDCTIAQAVAGNGAGGKYTLLGGYQGGATRIAAPGDCDQNGIVQLNDFACFANCFTGGTGTAAVECTLFDLDSDGDVDGDDYGELWVQLGN